MLFEEESCSGIDCNFRDFARHAKSRNNRNSSPALGKHDISALSVAANRKLMTGMHYWTRSNGMRLLSTPLIITPIWINIWILASEYLCHKSAPHKVPFPKNNNCLFKIAVHFPLETTRGGKYFIKISRLDKDTFSLSSYWNDNAEIVAF